MGFSVEVFADFTFVCDLSTKFFLTRVPGSFFIHVFLKMLLEVFVLSLLLTIHLNIVAWGSEVRTSGIRDSEVVPPRPFSTGSRPVRGESTKGA
jgi:hypothetical protein